MTRLAAILAILLATTQASSACAATYTFAGFEWDQAYAPTGATLLGNGVTLGGATFSSGLPTGAGSSNGAGFPDFTGASNYVASGSVFDTTKTIGRLTGLATTANSSRFVNLPNGDNGTSTRHGVEVTWATSDKWMSNGAGIDFVLYESASTSTQVENPMVRVRQQDTGTWSDWYYQPPSNFQLYVGDAAQGTMATGYDLSTFGLTAGSLVDAIQIANLTASDRIAGTITHTAGLQNFGVGKVVFDGSSTVKPDMGPLAGSARDTGYGSGSLDPDILYVVSVVPEPTGASLAMLSALGLGTLCGRRRRR